MRALDKDRGKNLALFELPCGLYAVLQILLSGIFLLLFRQQQKSQNRNMSNKEEEVERCKLAEQAERFVVVWIFTNFLFLYLVFIRIRADMTIWLLP